MSFLSELPSSKPVLKTSALLVFAGLFVAAELAVWLAFVPTPLSAATFSWLSALACMTVLAAAVTMVRARSTRSVAHVLYDTEHSSDSLSR
jgi:hypothetical protein